MPKVTYITVCLNAADTIRSTIESILRVMDDDVECVVVDGGSTDGTCAVLADCEPSFKGRLKWVSEPDGGIYDAMNKGLRLATGDWVNYQNDGDVLKAVPRDELSEAERAGCGLLAAAVETEDGVHEPRVSLVTHFRNTIPHQGAYYRRDVLNRLGGYDDSYRILGDHDLNVRLLRAGVKVRLSRAVYSFHSIRGLSSHGGPAIRAEMRRVVRSNDGFGMACLAFVSNKAFGLGQWIEAHLKRGRR